MRSGLGSLRVIARATLLLVAIALVTFIALYALALRWPAQFGFHLVTGFYFFLMENLSSLTTNSDIWVPGLIAFMLSVAIIHYLGRLWFKKKDKSWRFSNSLCLGLFIPTLFVIAFILPGLILQFSLLRDTKITERMGSSDRSAARMLASDVGQMAYMYALENNRQLPTSLEEALEGGNYYNLDYFIRNLRRDNLPSESILYLGGGLPTDSDPNLPIAISTAYDYDGKLMRFVHTFNAGDIEILDSELDEWIEKSLEAKRHFVAAKEGVDKVGEEPDENEQP